MYPFFFAVLSLIFMASFIPWAVALLWYLFEEEDPPLAYTYLVAEPEELPLEELPEEVEPLPGFVAVTFWDEYLLVFTHHFFPFALILIFPFLSVL